MSKRMIGIIAVAMLLDSFGFRYDLHAVPGSDVANEGGSSRSRSKQFIIHGKDGHTRGAFCVFCEEVKDELLEVLGQKDRWRSPIVLQLRGHTSDIASDQTVRPKIFRLAGGGFRIQADIEINEEFTAELLRGEIVRLILAEQILRPHPKADFKGSRSVLPEWLCVGVVEAIDHRRQGRPSRLFSSLVKSEQAVPLTDVIFAEKGGGNSISGEIYRASCCCLILALLGQDSGSMKVGRMISDLAVFRGSPKALLEKHFPEIEKSGHSLEQWWSLELASMAQPTVKDILDPLETERALKESLKVRYIPRTENSRSAPSMRKGARRILGFLRPVKKAEDKAEEVAPESGNFVEVDISEYRRFMDLSGSTELLDDIEVKLLHLSYRAFPLHRPMIRDYQAVLTQLARGKHSGIDEKLSELAAARVALAGLAGEATDYINWYEATQVKNRSGAFTVYKRAFEDLHRPLPPRRDSLSKYLDELDKEFYRD
ncbi:MAG: hypothetical protein GY899_16440 [Verrucomicrobiaceae bacterium]|nr:hypothetical protein [Verrucomicrobiaceae bacterium]